MADNDGGDVVSPKKQDSREDKLRILRERQVEERMRRLEELKKHAIETQQLREQKESERRRRLDEQRAKENERRSQVEERKRQINEVDRERREAIVRKNQERDARMETKRRNERSSIVFAFGSSTPRLLETTDSLITSSYWAPRRATSTANLRLLPGNTNQMSVSMAPSLSGSSNVPRRATEREIDIISGSKKRASSAGGLYRSLTCADESDTIAANRAGVYRRKTDLMPTTPSPRDGRYSSGTRSLARTPGRAHSLARLDTAGRSTSPSPWSSSTMSRNSTTQSMSRSTTHLAVGIPLVGGMPKRDASKSMVSLWRAAPALQPRTTRAERLRNRARARATSSSDTAVGASSSSGDVTPSRPGSVLSHNTSLMTSSVHSALQPRIRSAPPSRKSRPLSIHVTGVSKTPVEKAPDELKPKPKPKPSISAPKPQITKKDIPPTHNEDIRNKESKKSVDIIEENVHIQKVVNVNYTEKSSEGELLLQLDDVKPNLQEKEMVPEPEVPTDSNLQQVIEPQQPAPKPRASATLEEEEARAKLAERRRLAREAAEREAELERQRIEEEQRQEEERIRKEEEEQRLAEEEQLRLVEEARRMEEIRLMQAIQEAQKREEEEKLRKQQEENARLEKEEADRIAREEAEKQRLEKAERLKQVEEERQARRKRVETIMKRTRNTAPTNAEIKAECEKGEEDKAERENPEKNGNGNINNNNNSNLIMRDGEQSTNGQTINDSVAVDGVFDGNLEAFLHGERVSSERALLTNGHNKSSTTTNPINLINQSNNGLANEDCVSLNPTTTTPLIEFQGKAKDTPMPPDLLA